MKIEVGNYWLFADNLPQAGKMFEFVEAQTYEKNGKEQGIVFILLGSDNNRQGEFKVFPSKVSNLKDLVKKLGDDSKNWAMKRFIISPIGEKSLLFTLIQENKLV